MWNESAGPNQVDEANSWGNPDLPTREEVARRAHALWQERGCPEGSHEEDWIQAERELNSVAVARQALRQVDEKGGSVQS